MACCLIGWLTACAAPAAPHAIPGESAQPSSDPRPTPASSNGPARNLPRPQLPETAKQNTEQGFEAFTQFWFDAITYVMETGDPRPVNEISSPSCKMCQRQVEKANRLYEGGGWGIGPQRMVKGFKSTMVAGADKSVAAVFLFEELASVTYSKAGDVGIRYMGGMIGGVQAIHARFDEGKWVALEVGPA
jgi:hypothetical protein